MSNNKNIIDNKFFKNRILYYTKNKSNLKKVKFKELNIVKNRIENSILKNTKFKEYFIEIGIKENDIIKIKKNIFNCFIEDIEIKSNEFFASVLTDKIINYFLYENKYELETIPCSDEDIQYLNDKNISYNINDYKIVDDFLQEYTYEDYNPINMDISNLKIIKIKSSFRDMYYDFVYSLFINIANKEISKYTKRRYKSENSRVFKFLEYISQNYFEAFCKLEIKDLFFLFDNNKHKRNYKDCKLISDSISKKESYEKSASDSIFKFFNKLNSDNLSKIKLQLIDQSLTVNIGRGSNIHDNYRIVKMMSNIIFDAIVNKTPMTIMRTEYTFFKDSDNNEVQRTSGLSIVNGFPASLDRTLLKNVFERSTNVLQMPVNMMYSKFDDNLILILKNK